MKYFYMLFLYCLLVKPSLQAQQPVNDSTRKATINELKLTSEQKQNIKKLIWEYKMQDRKRRRELRHRIFMLLNVKQQRLMRNLWRHQLQNTTGL